jgi:hypothetical protein
LPTQERSVTLTPTHGARFFALLAAASAGLALGCASPQPSANVRNGPAGDGVARIIAEDSFFRPDLVELPTGKHATLEVTNHGDTQHDFSIEELGVSTGVIEPGEAKTITFAAPGGTTVFRCGLHDGMEGTIVAVGPDRERDVG